MSSDAEAARLPHAQGVAATQGEDDILLQVSGLKRFFGGLTALDDYAVTLNRGDLLGVIGPNGAGKTTLFNVLTGMVGPSAGTVVFKGQDVTGAMPHKLANVGLARTFQNIRNFHSLSVLQNVMLSAQLHQSVPLWRTVLLTKRHWAVEGRIKDRAWELLDLLDLEDVSEAAADELPYGRQRRLEIACALALSPDLLLLDEPAAGMNPTETLDLMNLIERVHRELGITIMLIEHNMHFIMNVCQRIQVLNHGEIIADGDPAHIRQHPAVIEAYLGRESEDA